MATNMKMMIELLIKNEKEFRELLSQLNEKFKMEIDFSQLDKAFEDLKTLQDENIKVAIDDEAIKPAVDDVEEKLKKIPHKKETVLSAKDSATAIINAVSNAYMALTYVIGQVRKGFQSFIIAPKDAARDAEEIASKYATVFDEVNAKAMQVAESLSSSFGIATSTSKELLGATGDILVGFGFSADMALDLSKQVNGLAIDLASFTNYSGGAKGASDALTKAILGETESAKALGIVLRQGTKEFKDRVDILKSEKNYTENQARALVLLEDAMKQSGKARGDFARTQHQLANQERILTESFKTLKEQIGNKLTPVFLSAAKGANTFLESFNKGSLIGTFETIKAFDGVEKQLGSLSTEYIELTNKTFLNTEEQKKMRDVIKSISELAPDAVTGFDVYGDALDVNIGKVNEFIRRQKTALRLQYNKQINDLAKDYQKVLEKNSELYSNNLNAQNRLNKASGDYVNLLKAANNQYGSLENAPDAALEIILKYKDVYESEKEIADATRNEFTTWSEGFNSTLNEMIYSLDAAGIDFKASPGNVAYQLGLDLKKDRALIDALIVRYDMLGSVKTTKSDPDDGNSTVLPSDDEIEKAQAKMDAFFLTLKDRQEQLTADYERKKSIAEIAYAGDPEGLQNVLTKLGDWYQSQQEKIRSEEKSAADKETQAILDAEDKKYQAQIITLQAKKDLGRDVAEELEQVENEYLEFLKNSYGEDSKQYLMALKQKESATKNFWKNSSKWSEYYGNAIGNGIQSMFSGMIRVEVETENKLIQGFANMANSFIAEVERMIAKWITFQLIKGMLAPETTFTSFLGFAEGKYTGDGGKYEPAGIVHKGEWVLDQEVTQPNLRELPTLHRLLASGVRLRDILTGGVSITSLVSPAYNIPTLSYASGGYTDSGELGGMNERLEKIEKAIKNIKLTGEMIIKDITDPVKKHKVALKNKAAYERQYGIR